MFDPYIRMNIVTVYILKYKQDYSTNPFRFKPRLTFLQSLPKLDISPSFGTTSSLSFTSHSQSSVSTISNNFLGQPIQEIPQMFASGTLKGKSFRTSLMRLCIALTQSGFLHILWLSSGTYLNIDILHFARKAINIDKSKPSLSFMHA